MCPMPELSDHPITGRWPPMNPAVIQLYSFPTFNGAKISIALEEMGLPYEVHRVTLSPADLESPEFLSLNPNGKVPAIIDPDGPDGLPLGLFESGAILLYLAAKSGQLGGKTAADKARVTQWLMFQMGALGPMIGQLGYFTKFAGAEIEDRRPRDHFTAEVKRLLAVLDGALEGQDWIAGDYSIADIAIAPWLRGLERYGVKALLGWDQYTNLVAYLDRFLARPAVQIGLVTPPREG